MTETFKIGESGDAYMTEEGFVPGAPIPDENFKNDVFHRKATRKSVLKTIKFRPQVPKIVLDLLKERNALSIDDISDYLAEKYEVYAKMLKNCVSRFLWKAEETGLIEKVIGADMKEQFKIKDGEKVQKYLQDLVSKTQELELMKDVHVQKMQRGQVRSRRQKKMYKEKTEKNEGSKKHNSRTKRRPNTRKKMTDISKTNQLEDSFMAKKELFAITSSAQKINNNAITEQKATTAVNIRPLIQKMVFESLKTLKKHNGTSVEEISAYIGENNEIDIKIIKSGINKFLRKGVKRGVFEKVVETNAEERFKFKKLEENEKSKQDLVPRKRKAGSMKIVPTQKRRIKRRRKTYWKNANLEKNNGGGERNRVTSGKESTIKVMTKISMIVKSDSASMTEKRSIDEELSIAAESHPVKHQKAKRKISKRPVAVRSQVPKIVLETLVQKEINALSVDEISVYIAEKYRVYTKRLRNYIRTFLTEVEETGLVEKVIGANMEEKFKIKDVEKVQTYVQDFVSKKQELELMKDVSVQKERGKRNRKGKRDRKKKTESDEDRDKHNTETNGKENPKKTKTKIFKIKKSENASVAETGLVVGKSVSAINGKSIIKQNATEKSAIKTVETRPLLQKMILESFKALKKSNGVSVEQIISYIAENHKLIVKKSQINKFLKRGVKHGAFEKVEGNNAEKIFKMKKAGEEHDLVSRKRKVEFMKEEKKKVPYTKIIVIK